MIEPNCRCPGCGECNASKEAPKLKKRNKEAAAELRRLHLVNHELVTTMEDLIGLVRAENDGELLTIQEAKAALAKAKGGSNE